MTQIVNHPEAGHPALATRLAAACRDPRHQCALVLAANAGLVVCAAAEPFTPTLALHLLLVPFNAWRLLHAIRTHAVRAVSRSTQPAAGMRTTAAARPMRQQADTVRLPVEPATLHVQTIRLAPRAAR